MTLPLRSRIAVRSAALMIGMILVVGIPVLMGIALHVRRLEESRQREHIVQLMDTVEQTAQVACFIRDSKLAEEMASGLLKNAVVGRVVITSGDSTLAGPARRGWSPGPGAPIRRAIHSPFDPTLEVGRLEITPDEAEIARQTAARGRFTIGMLLLQVLVVAVATVTVVLLLVTRPIRRISLRLHRLSAETGAKLDFPVGHETDEIGQLVADVNALIDRLLSLVRTERSLRDEVEATLAEVKTLQGLLPICAWCKKVRDDEGLWTQIEKYVTENTNTRFTHGLCPECAKEEMARYRERKEEPKT